MARGYIEKRGDVYRVRWRTRGGVHRSQTVGPRKKDAEQVLATRLREVAVGEREIEARLVSEFADEWLAVYVKPNYAYSTYVLYRDRLNAHILPALGKRQFDEIGADTVRQFAARLLSKDLQPATVNAVIRQLRVFFRHAREGNLLKHDPCKGVSVRVGKERNEMRFLSVKQLCKLADATDPRYRSLVLVAGLTGLRQGELFALRWEHIDFKNGHIAVRESLSYGEIKEPKSKSSVRNVFMCGEVAKLLKAHRLATGKRRGLIWQAPGGGFISKDNFRKRVFEKAVKKAKLQPLRFHDLRHTFVAFLIESGMGKNPLFVQRTLGHSKIDTTFGVYGHLFPSAEDEAREALSALIAAQSVPNVYPAAVEA